MFALGRVLPGDGTHGIIAVKGLLLDRDVKNVFYIVQIAGFLHCVAHHVRHHIRLSHRGLKRIQNRAEQHGCQGDCKDADDDQQDRCMLFPAARIFVLIVPATFTLMGGRRFVLLLYGGGSSVGRSDP